jgi:DNA-binding FadR family transcriptional regulator
MKENIHMKPIERVRVPALVAERLKELLLSGRYQPGDRLPSIKTLAAELGVGHTSLREGLKELETLGLIEKRQGAGLFVREAVNDLFAVTPIFRPTRLDAKTLQDLLHVRKLIETDAARLAAQHAAPADMDTLAYHLQQMSDQFDDADRFITHNTQFHLVVCRAAHNRVLFQVLAPISGLILAEQAMITSARAVRAAGLAWHHRIYEAVLARDAAEAARCMQAHLDDVEATVLRSEENTGDPASEQPI